VGGPSQHLDSCVPRYDEQAAMQSNCQFVAIINGFHYFRRGNLVIGQLPVVCLSVCFSVSKFTCGSYLDKKKFTEMNKKELIKF